jgi:uncharacterized protein YjeT (DUF2065 family)
MELALQKIIIICFLIIGLSHIFQCRAWAEFFIALHKQGTAGNFLNAFLNLWSGALIVAFHNVWSGIPLVLTLFGWVYCLKGLSYFVFPQVGLKMLSRISLARSRVFIAPSVLLVAYAGLLTYSIYRR